jgi:hypothetical protein
MCLAMGTAAFALSANRSLLKQVRYIFTRFACHS